MEEQNTYLSDINDYYYYRKPNKDTNFLSNQPGKFNELKRSRGIDEEGRKKATIRGKTGVKT